MIRLQRQIFVRWVFFIVLAFSGFSHGKGDEVGGDFSLTDHNGQAFELAQLRGKVVLLFFGYTHCPDICPTELASMAQFSRSLGVHSEKIQILFVTVDPARDTPSRLKQYVHYFSKNIIGLSGSDQEIEVVKEAYHVQSQIYRANEQAQTYSVDHSAKLYVIDQTGKLVNIVPYGFPITQVATIVNDLLGIQPP